MTHGSDVGLAAMDDRLIPFRHNAWATRVLLERCRALSAEEFSQPFPIGPGNLHDTLLHIIAAMGRWSDRIADRPVRPPPAPAGGRLTPDELLALLSRAADDLEAVATGVYARDLGGEMMSFSDPAGGEPFRFRRAAALVHVTTHGMHHRAQALNMLRRLGVDPLPEIDAIDWELAEGAAA